MTEYEGIARWLVSGRTGGSSKFMAAWFMGERSYRWRSHPVDGGDFERCLGLLRAVPSLRARLPELRDASLYWAALVDAWDRIEALAPNARYDVMRSILDPIERGDKSVVRLGDGVTMRFGR
jgi:hypothetical protein